MSAVSQFPPPHLVPDEGETSSATLHTEKKSGTPLALPAPSDEERQEVLSREAVTKLSNDKEASDDSAHKFDELGPLVVNTDGTLSRIHNWASMTDAERERTRRVLSKRNGARLGMLRDQADEDGADTSTR